jgi:hypothetical protein
LEIFPQKEKKSLTVFSVAFGDKLVTEMVLVGFTGGCWSSKGKKGDVGNDVEARQTNERRCENELCTGTTQSNTQQ